MAAPLPQATSVSPPAPAAEVLPSAVSLRLEVDFEARELRVRLGEPAEPITFVYDEGAWRPLLSPPGSDAGST